MFLFRDLSCCRLICENDTTMVQFSNGDNVLQIKLDCEESLSPADKPITVYLDLPPDVEDSHSVLQLLHPDSPLFTSLYYTASAIKTPTAHTARFQLIDTLQVAQHTFQELVAIRISADFNAWDPTLFEYALHSIFLCTLAPVYPGCFDPVHREMIRNNLPGAIRMGTGALETLIASETGLWKQLFVLQGRAVNDRLRRGSRLCDLRLGSL